MRRRRRRTLWLVALAAAACGQMEDAPSGEPEVSGESVEVEPASEIRPEGSGQWPAPADSIPGTPWTRTDWEIFQATLREAEARRLDTLPLGEAIAEMGALFLGTPYEPRTLEVPGPERLVVNLRALDCVTFVENVLALTRFHRAHGIGLLTRPEEARSRYEADLTQLRYREGVVQGYPDRLHYFSEWLAQGERTGRMVQISAQLGGVADPEPPTFMTSHRDAYEQLADEQALDGVRRVEASLAAAGPRIYIPEDRLPEAASGIRTGDIIAATSTLPGLDVAHTGIAFWRDGRLHLLHAPLVGSTVVLSERTLPERIQGIGSQDGVMVARATEPWFGGGG